MAQKQQNQEIETTRTKFLRLRHIWAGETQHLSSVRNATKHPAYRAIIDMGPEVLPLIIEDMRSNQTPFWYYAFHELIGKCPEIPEYARGRMSLINDLYIAWYEDREEKKEDLRIAVENIEHERDKRKSSS